MRACGGIFLIQTRRTNPTRRQVGSLQTTCSKCHIWLLKRYMEHLLKTPISFPSGWYSETGLARPHNGSIFNLMVLAFPSPQGSLMTSHCTFDSYLLDGSLCWSLLHICFEEMSVLVIHSFWEGEGQVICFLVLFYLYDFLKCFR